MKIQDTMEGLIGMMSRTELWELSENFLWKWGYNSKSMAWESGEPGLES